MLKRRTPRDTSALYAALTRGTYDDFLEQYSPSTVLYAGYSQPLLCLALRNKNPHGGVKIAHRLLDDGADVTVGAPLHVLVAGYTHDFEGEARLLQRLLDLGADVNEVRPKIGTPLETAAEVFKFSDRDLTPFYDVLLARPDIDFLQQSVNGRPVIVRLRKWYAKRGHLVERIEALMVERGIPLPEPER